MGGPAHVRVVLIASSAGIWFGFDTAVIAGVTHALRETISLSPPPRRGCLERIVGHIARALIAGRRVIASIARHAAPGWRALCGFVIRQRCCVESLRVCGMPIPRRQCHRRVVGTRSCVSC